MIIKVVNKSGLPLPTYQSDGSACMDICVSDETEINSEDTELCHTGLYVEIPKGWCLKIYARSSLHKHGFVLANGVGIIDSDYRGEIMIAIRNVVDGMAGVVHRGARVAQAMLERVEPIEWQEAESLEETTRGTGGFGSTDKPQFGFSNDEKSQDEEREPANEWDGKYRIESLYLRPDKGYEGTKFEEFYNTAGIGSGVATILARSFFSRKKALKDYAERKRLNHSGIVVVDLDSKKNSRLKYLTDEFEAELLGDSKPLDLDNRFDLDF